MYNIIHCSLFENGRPAHPASKKAVEELETFQVTEEQAGDFIIYFYFFSF